MEKFSDDVNDVGVVREKKGRFKNSDKKEKKSPRRLF